MADGYGDWEDESLKRRQAEAAALRQRAMTTAGGGGMVGPIYVGRSPWATFAESLTGNVMEGSATRRQAELQALRQQEFKDWAGGMPSGEATPEQLQAHAVTGMGMRDPTARAAGGALFKSALDARTKAAEQAREAAESAKLFDYLKSINQGPVSLSGREEGVANAPEGGFTGDPAARRQEILALPDSPDKMAAMAQLDAQEAAAKRTRSLPASVAVAALGGKNAGRVAPILAAKENAELRNTNLPPIRSVDDKGNLRLFTRTGEVIADLGPVGKSRPEGASADRPTPKKGYRYKDDGTQEFIPGGPADPATKAAKPLMRYMEEGVREVAGTKQTLERLTSQFKPEYAGGLGTEIEVKAGQMLGGSASADMQEKANFWRDVQFFDDMPARNKMFGATLSPAEKESWANATISPRLSPDKIRERLAMRQKIYTDALARMRASTKAGGYNVEQFDAAAGMTALPEGVTQAQWDAMSPEDRELFK